MVCVSVTLRSIREVVDAVFHSGFILSQSFATNQTSRRCGSSGAYLYVLENQLHWNKIGKTMRGTESLAIFQGTRPQEFVNILKDLLESVDGYYVVADYFAVRIITAKLRCTCK